MKYLKTNAKDLLTIIVLLLLPLGALIMVARSSGDVAPVCTGEGISTRVIGCGLIPAISFMVRGDFRSALDYDWRVLIIVPLIVILYLSILIEPVKRIAKRKRERKNV